MGADTFQTISFGPNATEAFRNAQEEARYEHGHHGYTGTIAEKDGFELLALPPRVTARKFLGWLEAYETAAWATQEAQQAFSSDPRRKDAAKRAAAARKAFPAKHEALLARAYRIHDDKWGPALALELTGAEKTKMKARYGRKGARGRAFIFAGFASS